MPDNPEDDTKMETHCEDALNSTVKSLMHPSQTEDEEAQLDAVHRMIQIAKSWMKRRWSESNLGNRRPPVQIPKKIAHLMDPE